MTSYGNSDYSLFWSEVRGDNEKIRKTESLVHAKTKTAKFWPFVSAAVSEADLETRLSLILPQIEASVGDEAQNVIEGFREDYRAVTAASKTHNMGGKYREKDYSDDELESRHNDLKDEEDEETARMAQEEKNAKYSAKECGECGAYGRHEKWCDKGDYGKAKQAASERHPDDESFASGHAHGLSGSAPWSTNDHYMAGHERGVEQRETGQRTATNYQPDPDAAWRYHQPYQQLQQPVNNGDLQDGDGFPTDLAQGENRSQPILESRSVPGTWTQHDGMPERPMPAAQQRGYMPVNAKFDAQGFLVEADLSPGYGEGNYGGKWVDDDQYYTPSTGRPGTTSGADCDVCYGDSHHPTGAGPHPKGPVKNQLCGHAEHDSCHLDHAVDDHLSAQPAAYAKDYIGMDASLHAQANQYIKQQGDQWVITQKGTGKVLSHHDSKEKAEASFAAMEMNKHSKLTQVTSSAGVYSYSNADPYGSKERKAEIFNTLAQNGWDTSEGYHATKHFPSAEHAHNEVKSLTGVTPNQYCDSCYDYHHMISKESSLGVAFDKQGFLITSTYEDEAGEEGPDNDDWMAAEKWHPKKKDKHYDGGRLVESVIDPVPGQFQKHNPFYFQPETGIGQNEGFPADPSPEPLLNTLDEIYGDVAPVNSAGSTEGTVDGQGYSRLDSQRPEKFDKEGFLVVAEEWAQRPSVVEKRHVHDYATLGDKPQEYHVVCTDPSCTGGKGEVTKYHGTDHDLADTIGADHVQHHHRQFFDDKYGQGAHESEFPELYHASKKSPNFSVQATPNVLHPSEQHGSFVVSCPDCSMPPVQAPDAESARRFAADHALDHQWGSWANEPYRGEHRAPRVAVFDKEGYAVAVGEGLIHGIVDTFKSRPNRQQRQMVNDSNAQYLDSVRRMNEMFPEHAALDPDELNSRLFGGRPQHVQSLPELHQGLDRHIRNVGSTDGRIVGQCPGCKNPIRRHDTPHGDEFRHLHNDSVRCHGNVTAGLALAPLAEEAAGAEGAGGMKSKIPGFGGGSPHSNDDHGKDDEDSSGHSSAFDDDVFGRGYGGNGRDLPGVDKANSWATASRHEAADYLGRPDANNPTGRGADEYKARTWDAYETTRPMQSQEDRNVNTPVLPSDKIKTRQINSPTPGHSLNRDTDRLEQDGGEEEDED